MTPPHTGTPGVSHIPRAVAPMNGHASAPLPSDQLLQGRKAVEISHNGAVYRLQTTKLGKLILTK